MSNCPKHNEQQGASAVLNKKILIVEDEDHLAKGLMYNLEAEGYMPLIAGTGEEVLKALAENDFGVIILDVMLPGIDGFQVAEEIRSRSDHTPILMLTARGQSEDVLRGFEAGVDDYLPKPFELSIFLARVNGLLRRSNWSKTTSSVNEMPERLTINGRTIDLANNELVLENETVQLTLMEVKLLRFLIERTGQAVSRSAILQEVWGLQEDTDTRAIDNFVVRLRRYLEDEPNNPKILLTIRGVGYKFIYDGDQPA